MRSVQAKGLPVRMFQGPSAWHPGAQLSRLHAGVPAFGRLAFMQWVGGDTLINTAAGRLYMPHLAQM